jgi:serine/threonine protein kinase/formylglycine-generating enzyme required for sulfatase activity
MALALRRYRKTLLASGLFDPAELRAFERSLPPSERPANPDELSQALVEAGKLTAFQAAELQTGRGLGLVLGNYVVLDRIGAGGMGQVYKAWHRRMHRTVALKTLPERAAAGEDSIARFRREILSAAQLSHPNIVAAYDADVAQNVHFLVMEYVDGPNLSDVVRQHGPLPIAQVVRYVLDAARGLAYAHQRGIVHRDVKPSNLIVDPSGVVKVLDLGLARTSAAMAGAELTLPGDVVGTLEYMAPEQAAGSPDVDRRADVYGLGCTLYRLITGQFLYNGGSASALIAAHRDEKIPSLRSLRDEVPRSLDAVFKRMVAKQPADRFQNMDEVITALERLRLNEKRSVGRPALVTEKGTSSAAGRRVGAPFGAFLGPAHDEGSGDDLQLVSDAGRGIDFQPIDDPPKISQAPPPPVVSFADANEDTGSPPVSPLVALAALVAALAGITALSWFDSTDRNQTESLARPQRIASCSAGERARRWAESLGVPASMTNSLQMRFVLVPPAGDDENVSPGEVRTPFYLGVCELTVGQYRQFAAATGHRTAGHLAASLSGQPVQGDRHPVIDLTAEDAEAFCRWLSQRESASYRLPTQAEWTQACRGDAAGQSWPGEEMSELGRYAWYESNSGGRTHQVGLLEANPFGLHDLLGNSAEWCVIGNSRPSTAAQGKSVARHILCGGSWSSPASALSSFGAGETTSVTTTGGLRMVLELPLEARWPHRRAALHRRSNR